MELEPSLEVSCVVILAARMEQMATLILFMEWFCQVYRQSMTRRAQRKRSKLTSCKMRSLQMVRSTFFCNC